MLEKAILGGILGAFTYRWRGTGRSLLSSPAWLVRATGKGAARVACGALVALPVLTAVLASVLQIGFVTPLSVGTAFVAYALVTAASTYTVGLAHGDYIDLGKLHGTALTDVGGLSLTGLAFTGPAAIVLLGLGSYLACVALVAAGLTKGPAYFLGDLLDRKLLPARSRTEKYITREVLFGAFWGAAALAVV